MRFRGEYVQGLWEYCRIVGGKSRIEHEQELWEENVCVTIDDKIYAGKCKIQSWEDKVYVTDRNKINAQHMRRECI